VVRTHDHVRVREIAMIDRTRETKRESESVQMRLRVETLVRIVMLGSRRVCVCGWECVCVCERRCEGLRLRQWY